MQQEQWRDQLIAQHANMARRIALKMARRCPTHVAREDLVAAGLLGLTEAEKAATRAAFQACGLKIS